MKKKKPLIDMWRKKYAQAHHVLQWLIRWIVNCNRKSSLQSTWRLKEKQQQQKIPEHAPLADLTKVSVCVTILKIISPICNIMWPVVGKCHHRIKWSRTYVLNSNQPIYRNSIYLNRCRMCWQSISRHVNIIPAVNVIDHGTWTR